MRSRNLGLDRSFFTVRMNSLHRSETSWLMSYTVIARRWRPKRFEDVVGQAHVVTTLKNSIRRGRIAHAYLFAGPRGVGKTSISRILAKAVNCVEGVQEEPCNVCETCTSIDSGGFVDVIEIDAASNTGHRRDQGTPGDSAVPSHGGPVQGLHHR